MKRSSVNIFDVFIFQISVATFHIGRLELAQQSVGSQACIKLQAASLSGEECPAISWEEFQVLKKNQLKILKAFPKYFCIPQSLRSTTKVLQK